jgi:hypothetical protein
MTNYISASGLARGLILLTSVQLTHAAATTNITVSAGLMLDDNITRAQYQRDIYDDRAVFAGLSSDYSLSISDHSRAQFTANVETWRYQESNLDHNLFSLQADYILQPVAGYTAPWYILSLTYGISGYDDEYRDANFNELGLVVAKRLTDATIMRFGISRQSSSADSEIFSLTSTRLYGNLDFKLDQNTLYTTLAYNTGDITSTNTPPHPPSLSSVPWVDDDDAFPGLNNTWTYKLDADTWSLRLGYVYAITGMQSFDASVLYYSSSAYGGNDYDGIISSITYFYRF